MPITISGITNRIKEGVNKAVNSPINFLGTTPQMRQAGLDVGKEVFRLAKNPSLINKEVIQPTFNFLKPPIPMTQKLGEAAALPQTQKLFQQTQNLNQNQADLYTKKAIEASKAGDQERANRFFEASKTATGQAGQMADQRVGELEKSKQELIKSGLNTMKLPGIAFNPAGAATMAGAGSVLNTSLSSIFDQPTEGTLTKGGVEGFKMAGVTNITNPIIAGLVGKFTASLDNPTVKSVTAKLLSGIGNVLEDKLIDKTNNVDRTKMDDIFSFTLGALMAGNGDLTDWENLKKQLSPKSIGLDQNTVDNIVDLSRQAASRLNFETKYQEMMNGDVVPKVVLASRTTIDGVGREVDRLLTRDEAIKAGYNVLSPEAEASLKTKYTQGGFIGVKEDEPAIKKSPADTEAEIGPQTEPVIEPPMRERGFIDTILGSKEADKELKSKIRSEVAQYTDIVGNEDTLIKAKMAVDKDYQASMTAFETNQVKDQDMTAIGMSLIKKAQENKNYTDAIRVADELSTRLTQAGRTVQAARMWTELSPETMQKKLARVFQEANQRSGTFGKKAVMTDELAKKIDDVMTQVEKTTDVKEKNRLTSELLDEVSQYIPPSAWELVDAYRHGNMLSNPKSWLKNLVGNLNQAFGTKPLTMAFETPIDYAGSLLNGTERTKYFSDIPKYYKNLFNATSNSFEGFKSVMKNPTILDMEGGFLSTSNLDRYLQAKRTPKAFSALSRPMEALDKLISIPMAAAEKARLIDLGIPEAEAEQQAKALAERWLFRSPLDPTNKSGQGSLLTAFDKVGVSLKDITKKFRPLSWISPYIGTPVQIAKQLVEFSPAGFATLPGSSKKRTTEQLAKAIAGSLATMAGFQAVQNAETTWAVPTNEDQKDLFYSSGKKPYSIKIGDKWIPFAYLGTLGLTLAIPAANKYYAEQSPKSLTDTDIEKIQKSVSDTAGYVSSQLPIPTLLEVIQIITGQSNKKLGDVAGFSSSQFVPASGMLRFMAEIFDPIYRKADGFVENIQRGIPFASKSLTPYLDVSGQPSQRGPLETFAPYAIGTSKPEIEQRLDFLQKLQQVKAVPTWYKKELQSIQDNIKEIYRNQATTQEEKDRLVEKENVKLQKLQQRYETIVPKATNLLNPSGSAPVAPKATTTPANIQPTNAPVQRKAISI